MKDKSKEEVKGEMEEKEPTEESVKEEPKVEEAPSSSEVPEEGDSTSADEEVSSGEKPSEPDWKALYALTLADFDNYKKRTARDREDTYRYAEADIIKDVLPSVDNLALALANATDRENDDFVKGVKLVYDTFLAALKEHQAEPFDCVGQDLDTEKMEAIATLPSEEFEEGKVSIESKRGWMLKGKVLRAAQVVVSSGKSGGK